MSSDPPSVPKKRKGRPLLLAGLGVAAVSFVACNEPKTPDGPVGNLRGPEPTLDGGSPVVSNPPPVDEQPVGNLRPPDPPPQDAGAMNTPDPTPAPTGTVPQPKPTHHPVGNLRAPSQ